MDGSTAVMLALVTYLAVIMVIGIIYYVLFIIGAWRINTKAGEAGWKAIIPILNGYILYKISWKTSMFWIMLGCEVIGSILSSMDSSAAIAIGAIFAIAGAVISIIQLYKLSQCFGHGVGYTIGLILLSPIFIMILGLGSSQYTAPGESVAMRTEQEAESYVYASEPAEAEPLAGIAEPTETKPAAETKTEVAEANADPTDANAELEKKDE